MGFYWIKTNFQSLYGIYLILKIKSTSRLMTDQHPKSQNGF
jgi:hypothetical protein